MHKRCSVALLAFAIAVLVLPTSSAQAAPPADSTTPTADERALFEQGTTDLTAGRAGLLLAGDLETVVPLRATDPPGTTPLAPKQRLLETIHFTVTEDYFTIRQHLGL